MATTDTQGGSSQTYPYYKNIRSPTAIGMSDKGTMSALGNDIDGLMAYVDVLVSGKSKGSATGRPLGNKFFVKTKASCKDTVSGKTVPRSFYANNIPMGNIPFISSGMGTDFSDFRGLLPGVISGLNAFDPAGLVSSFSEGGTPDCRMLTMETIDSENTHSVESNYITVSDIKDMDACLFPNGKNPMTKGVCSGGEYKGNIAPLPFSDPSKSSPPRRKKRSGFRTGIELDDFMFDTDMGIPMNDPACVVFFASIGILGIYITHCLYANRRT